MIKMRRPCDIDIDLKIIRIVCHNSLQFLLWYLENTILEKSEIYEHNKTRLFLSH